VGRRARVQRLVVRSLQQRRRVDHDVDRIRLDADGAACGCRFQRFRFPAIGAGYPKSQPFTGPLIGGN
jgi:hypothetical protein